MGTGPANLSAKRKSSEKTDRLSKKPKVVPKSVVGLKVKTKKTVTSIGQRRGKGLMTGPVPVTENHPSSSMRILSMRWKSSCPSSRLTTKRI